MLVCVWNRALYGVEVYQVEVDMVTEKYKKSDKQKKAVKEFIEKNEGIQAKHIMRLLFISGRRVTTILSQMVATGTIYRTGSTYTVRYWSSEKASKNPESRSRELSDKELEHRRLEAKKKKQARSEMPGMVFLCKSRPKGTNIIFEQCKSNNEHSLMVYRVMAGVK